MTTEPPLIHWGRCRSGRRWFWTAQGTNGDNAHGWADTPDAASRQANAAVVQLAVGRYANIRVLHATATEKLKTLNAAKRTAKAPKTKPTSTGPVPPVEPVGYLYAVDPGRYDTDDQTWIPASVVSLPITKKTTKRIYYLRPRNSRKWEAGYVDRQELERHGSVRSSFLFLFAEPPELPKPAAAPNLKALKAAMRAAHPDLGGSDAEFIAARHRYEQARRRAA